MSFGAGQTAQQPVYNGIPISTSVSTLPIPVGWGQGLLAPNLIDYVDFTKTSKSASGKGGKGDQVDYTASIDLALCEGPIGGIVTVWKDQSTTESLSDLGLTLIPGALNQSPWGYMTTAHPSHGIGYSGVAHLVAENYDLGGTPAVPIQNMEVQFPLLGTASWLNAFDADLALIVSDFLTNPQYGAYFPSGSIDAATLMSTGAATTTGDASLQTWCRANGLGFSPVLSSQEAANSILDRWLNLALVAPVWSGNVLKFIPYGDTAITANGVTYLPNLTPAYDLTDDDFVGDSNADPVNISRVDPADIYNVYRLECLDRGNAYNAVPVESRDQADIDTNPLGRRVASTITAHEACVPAVGQILVDMAKQRGLAVRNTFDFSLSWEFCLLEPMDIVRVPDQVTGDWLACRLTSVEEDDNGELTIQGEEFIGGVHAPVVSAVQGIENFPVNTAVKADPVNPPVIFEPTADLVSTPQVWVAASGGTGGINDPMWGGAKVWISTETTGYEDVGEIQMSARQGVLTASLPSYGGSNPDAGNTLSVNLTESDGQLESTTDFNAMAGLTLCYCDGELLTFTGAAMTGANQYDLTGLYRGLYGTRAKAHAIGSLFARLDDAVFKFNLPIGYVGKTLNIKLQSFNVFNRGLQDLSTCVVYQYTPTGSAFVDLQYLLNGDTAPAGIMVDQSGVPIKVNVAV